MISGLIFCLTIRLEFSAMDIYFIRIDLSHGDKKHVYIFIFKRDVLLKRKLKPEKAQEIIKGELDT